MKIKKIKESLKNNKDFYYNEKGFLVFTKEYHLKRGYCCKNNCLNCPYNFENKPEDFVL
jgi:hypothetical protein